MPKSRDYDQQEIAVMRETLKALPKKQREKTRFSTAETVKTMRAEIRAAITRGYTLDEVITALNNAGTFDLKTPTIKRYMTDAPRRRTASAISGTFKGRKNGNGETIKTEPVREKQRAVELPSSEEL